MEPNPTIFEPGSTVEVSIDGGGIHGSWLSSNIISCVDSNRFLVQYHKLRERAVVDLHRLRPLPPPENQPEFKCGNTVEAFRNNRWWEGHVTEDLQNGSFLVSFNDSEKMTFPRELLRTPREWINHNWVLSNRDIISELPDHVLLHIMDFMETKEAVKTCVLSRRWQHLCKGLTNVIYNPDPRLPRTTISIENFQKFASWFMFSRDVSCPLHNLTFTDSTTFDYKLLDKVIKHALFCKVQNLTLNLVLEFESLPLVFCSNSLTSLELCHEWDNVILPKSLRLPAVKNLRLECFKFSLSDNDSAEPFSNCFALNTLALESCFLPNDGQVLRISNSTLSSLIILTEQDCQIVLSTPNICSITFGGDAGLQLFSTCKFPFLGEVDIDVMKFQAKDKNEYVSVMMEWLQVLANVKTLAFSMHATQKILDALPYLSLAGPQPPSFVRLESLKLRNRFNVSRTSVDTLVKYLLQNSPMDGIDILHIHGSSFCLFYV